MSCIKPTLIFLFFSLSFLHSDAQKSDTLHETDHEHVHPLFELGVSSAAVKLIEENEMTVGFHIHASTNISHDLPFTAGLGYEYIVDEHQHHSFGLLIGWNPIHELCFSVSPGVTSSKGVFQFAAHIEVNYAFELGKIHLGPALEYAYSLGDTHISLGLHVGIPINID